MTTKKFYVAPYNVKGLSLTTLTKVREFLYTVRTVCIDVETSPRPQ